MANELVLIRHGEVDPALRGRFLGSTDVPLSEGGRLQAERLAARLTLDSSMPCYCSPMKRVMETAQLALGNRNHPVIIGTDLREIDFGRWEGLTFGEISDADPELVDRWAVYDPEFAFPDGESIEAFQSRLRGVADRFSSEPVERIIAFTHGGVIRALICHFLGLDPRNYLLFDVQPASIARIKLFGDKGILAGLNDTSHLAED